MPKINPDVLIWARNKADMGIEQAAEKIGVSSRALVFWECGAGSPEPKMIAKMAQAYNQPLNTFYMLNPPIEPKKSILEKIAIFLGRRK